MDQWTTLVGHRQNRASVILCRCSFTIMLVDRLIQQRVLTPFIILPNYTHALIVLEVLMAVSAEHLTAESYIVIICQQSYLLLFGIPSPTHSFIPGLKPLPANLSNCSPCYFLRHDSLHGFPWLFTVISDHIRFYRAMLCIRGTSHGPVSVSVCVCPSVTSQSSTKTAKRRITQTTPHGTPNT